MSKLTLHTSSKLPAILPAPHRPPPRHPPRSRPTRRTRPKGAAVTVLKAAKSCFADIVEVSGIVLARDETSVRPERPGLKVAELTVDAGDTVTAGQTLARLTIHPTAALPRWCRRRFPGTIAASTAVIGSPRPRARARRCSPSSRATNSISSAWCPSGHRPAHRSTSRPGIKMIGAGEVDGVVRRVAPTVETNGRLGKVFIGITADAAAVDEFLRAGDDQDRAELRRLGAAHRGALRPRPARGPGGEGRAGSKRGGSKSG